MANNILDFRRNAQSEGICDEYLALWDKCVSKREMFDLACRIAPSKYLVKSISQGWGISPCCLRDDFARFINGQYKAKFEGRKGNFYTSQLWCCSEDDSIVLDTTLCVMVSCSVDVYVRDYEVCRIVSDATSCIRVHLGKGSRLFIETYSDAISIEERGDKSNFRVKKLK